MNSMRRIVVALAALAVTGLAGACDSGGGGTEPVTDGEIEVTVTLDGAAAAGIGLELFQAGGTAAQATGTTGTDGSATWRDLEPGSYEVAVDVLEGFELADGEARRGISVTGGSTATVSFALETLGGSEVVEVLLRQSLEFSPSELTIQAGQTVRWRNEVAMAHTVTPDGHSEWNDVSLSAAGATFTHTFNSAGTFPYFCAPHLSAGMTGVITVE